MSSHFPNVYALVLVVVVATLSILDVVRSDDVIGELRDALNTLSFVLNESGRTTSGNATATTTTNCERNDAICQLRKMCSSENVDCEALLGVLQRRFDNGDRTANCCGGITGSLNLNTIFVSIIILLKCIIVGLGTVIARRYCNDRREARERNRAFDSEYGPMTIHDYDYDYDNDNGKRHRDNRVYRPTTITTTTSRNNEKKNIYKPNDRRQTGNDDDDDNNDNEMTTTKTTEKSVVSAAAATTTL